MSLKLSYCKPDDAPQLSEITLAAFEVAPRFIVGHGKVPRDVQLKRDEEGYRKSIASQGDPNAAQQKHCLKVTDPTTGDIMAFAIWCWLPNGYKPEEDSQTQVPDAGFPEGTNEAMVRDLWRMTGQLRSEHPGRREEHWCECLFPPAFLTLLTRSVLSIIGTHPKHERKGAAGMLICWPFERADKQGKRCYVDSSVTGYKLYKRYGFEDVGEMLLDVDKYDAKSGYGVQRWVAMVREPRKII